MLNPKIFIADTDTTNLQTLSTTLSPNYEVTCDNDLMRAATLMRSQLFHLILLDFHLAPTGGLEFMQAVRPYQPHAAFIVMCKDATHLDVQQAMRAQVDDFLFKPVNLVELRNRIALNLIKKPAPCECPPQIITTPAPKTHTLGALRLDPDTRTIHFYGELILLTPTEFCILHTLILSVGHYLSATSIVKQCRNYYVEEEEAREIIKPHIFNLRRKLEMDGKYKRIILNKSGEGFIIAPSE